MSNESLGFVTSLDGIESIDPAARTIRSQWHERIKKFRSKIDGSDSIQCFEGIGTVQEDPKHVRMGVTVRTPT